MAFQNDNFKPYIKAKSLNKIMKHCITFPNSSNFCLIYTTVYNINKKVSSISSTVRLVSKLTQIFLFKTIGLPFSLDILLKG